jgi:hypothetical protein
MDLSGKRMKIQRENAGQQLTDRLTQHNLDLDTLVPVIEDWDTTLSAYDSALSTELDRREGRTWRLEEAHTRTQAKLQRNTQDIQLPTSIRRGITLTKRVARLTAKLVQLREVTEMLQEQ